jgi:NAD(P)-dependent dehydrogenase (short-subunit alcohol dehydrogenase family)
MAMPIVPVGNGEGLSMVQGNLAGKVAVITGAGGGIGAATAERMAAAGAAVALADINGDAVKSVAARLQAQSLDVRAFVADISQESDVRVLVAETLGAFGRIDILHNNAAIVDQQDRTIVDLDAEVWDRTLAVNVRGPMLLCKHAVPGMIERGQGGVIINTSSQASEHGQADAMTAYGASKGALNSLTLYLAAQLGRYKIRCNAVVLGVVLTDGLRKLLPPEHVEAMSQHAILGRVSEPRDVAGMIHFLASEDAELITGRLLHI